MIDDELLAKFDRIQDLPVSEEMLDVYVESHLIDSTQRSVTGLHWKNGKSALSLYPKVCADCGTETDIVLTKMY